VQKAINWYIEAGGYTHEGIQKLLDLSPVHYDFLLRSVIISCADVRDRAFVNHYLQESQHLLDDQQHTFYRYLRNADAQGLNDVLTQIDNTTNGQEVLKSLCDVSNCYGTNLLPNDAFIASPEELIDFASSIKYPELRDSLIDVFCKPQKGSSNKTHIGFDAVAQAPQWKEKAQGRNQVKHEQAVQNQLVQRDLKSIHALVYPVASNSKSASNTASVQPASANTSGSNPASMDQVTDQLQGLSLSQQPGQTPNGPQM
jgi:hypothetical protein